MLADRYHRYGLEDPPRGFIPASYQIRHPWKNADPWEYHAFICFLPKSGKTTRLYTEIGWIDNPPGFYEVRPVNDDPTVAENLNAGGFNDTSPLIQAMLLARTGYPRLGAALLAKIEARSLPSGMRDDPKQSLHYWAYEVLATRAATRPWERRAMLGRLHDMPQVDGMEGEDPDLLADIQSTLDPDVRRFDRFDDELTALTTCSSQQWPELGHLSELFARLPRPFIFLWLSGFDAVPALLRHINDRRLTTFRHLMVTARPIRVGDVAVQLLAALEADPDVKHLAPLDHDEEDDVRLRIPWRFIMWWNSARKAPEPDYLISKMNGFYGGGYQRGILASKYPARMALFLTDQPYWTRVDLFMDVRRELSDGAYRKLMWIGASKALSPTSAHFLGALEGAGDKAAAKTVIGLFDKMPPQMPANTDERDGFIELVHGCFDSTDPGLWAAMTRALKRASPDFRGTLLWWNVGHKDYADSGRFATTLLAGFLDDAETCSIPERYWFGPGRGRPVQTTIQRIATEDLGVHLGLPQPGPDATGAVWDEYRRLVKETARRTLGASSRSEVLNPAHEAIPPTDKPSLTASSS